jgi:translation initiation factor IF-2
VVAGTEFGKVKALMDDHNKRVHHVFPGTPVEILGFSGPPKAGDAFIVVDSESKAREYCDFKKEQEKNAKFAPTQGTIHDMLSRIASGESKELSLIVKADVQGSGEAIVASLQKMVHPEVKVKILLSGVGAINESDVSLAKTSKALILAFNVRATSNAKELSQKDMVDIRYYSIIYEMLNDVKGLLEELLAPDIHEKFLGYAEIRDVFNISRYGVIAGCYVTEGIIKRGTKVRLLRDNVVVFEGNLKSLRRFKDEVKEVKESYECGMALENYNDIKVGDMIECFEMEEKKRSLDA